MPHLDKFPLLHLVLEYNILRTIADAKKENGHSSRNYSVIQTVVTAIGQKLGLAVSITSVANEAGNRSNNPEQSVEEVIDIKVENVKEEPADTGSVSGKAPVPVYCTVLCVVL